MIQAGLIGLVRLLTGVRVIWAGVEPSTRQRVYYANHTSNLDTLVIWAALPPALRLQTRPVAAQDYWRSSRVRRYLADRVFNAVLIERHHVTVKSNPLRPILEAIDAGSSLIIFPEGGRKAGDDLGAFQGGIYHLARHRPSLEFVPAWIDNVNRVLPKGEVLPVPMLGSITLGAPILLQPEETKPDFLARARSALMDGTKRKDAKDR